MDFIYILIIIILLFVIFKKKIVEFYDIKIKWLWNIGSKWIYKFLYKVIEVFWMIVLGIVIMLPIVIYYIGKKWINFSYNEYKELLDVTLNSYYVIVFAIVVIVYLFRNQLKKKIEQLSEVNQSGLKFDQDSQASKSMSNVVESVKNITSQDSENYEKQEFVYEEIKEKFFPGDNENIAEENLQVENEKLKQQIEEIRKELKIEKFLRIKDSMANTTKIALLYINGKYKYNNSFEIEEIKNVIKEISKLSVEPMIVYQFLKVNNLIDCEEESSFSVNEYGKEFLEFLFEGGK